MINEIDSTKLGVLTDQSIRLIDVRSKSERDQVNIPQSEHLPLHLVPLKINEYGKKETIIFYCANGARASQACFYFQSRGYDNVFNLRGGISAWTKNNSV